MQCQAQLDTSRTLTIAGLNPDARIFLALQDAAWHAGLTLQYALSAKPPHAWDLVRLENAQGTPLHDVCRQSWHRPPYALSMHLVRYAANSCTGTIVDTAVIGTRGPRHYFEARVRGTGFRLVRDFLIGRNRCPPVATEVAAQCDALRNAASAWLDYIKYRLQQILLVERWAIGHANISIDEVLQADSLGRVSWLTPRDDRADFADPFPWPGSGHILCERIRNTDGHGTIVALPTGADSLPRNVREILAETSHHSYPCVFREDSVTYLLPESVARGATVLYRLQPDTSLVPLCAVAPSRRLADPTLFQHEGRYWIACTDLDIGEHDNLCLLHSENPTGPWQSHRCTPVKFDIRGARPAGPVFPWNGILLRPGQDCASTYGAGVALHRIDELTPDSYRESVVAQLRPDPCGLYPHGLHTFSPVDGAIWLDGKRLVFQPSAVRQKLVRRIHRLRARYLPTDVGE